jgi:hypothetical protein
MLDGNQRSDIVSEVPEPEKVIVNQQDMIDELRKELKLKQDIAKGMSDKVQELELTVKAKDCFILELQEQRNRALNEAANFGSLIQQMRNQQQPPQAK